MSALVVGAATFRGQAFCESCCSRPATKSVSLRGAKPFSVCDDCAPTPRPVVERAADATDDVPPLDWSGELRLTTSRVEIARVVVGILAPGLLALLTFHLGGGTDNAFLAMVAVGVTTGAFSAWLDRRLLGYPSRWGWHRARR